MPDSVAPSVRITIVTPAARGSNSGNRVTALRWAGLLRQLGHRVTISDAWRSQPTDVLIAVHAVKSARSVLAASNDCPDMPIVTLLAGTDIYGNTTLDSDSQEALKRATALIALQPHALKLLPKMLRDKTTTIVQSATAAPGDRQHRFTAAVLAHLRPVKNPLLAITATAMLPKSIDMELILAGESIDTDYRQLLDQAIAKTDRASWVGPLSRRACKELLASSHICIVPSEAEGGANVVSESIAAGTPILCSAIPGNLGLLGEDWPGAFPQGDASALAKLLEQAATDPAFLDNLCLRTKHLQPMVAPNTERIAWRELLKKLTQP